MNNFFIITQEIEVDCRKIRNRNSKQLCGFSLENEIFKLANALKKKYFQNKNCFNCAVVKWY